MDGVAMVAALADQPGSATSQDMLGAQLPAEMRIQGGREVVAHGLVRAWRAVVVVESGEGMTLCWTRWAGIRLRVRVIGCYGDAIVSRRRVGGCLRI